MSSDAWATSAGIRVMQVYAGRTLGVNRKVRLRGIAFRTVPREPMELVDAAEISLDHGVERDLRDFVGGLTYSGTSDIQLNVIASLLGAD